MFWNRQKRPEFKAIAANDTKTLTARHGTYFRTATFEQRPLHQEDGSYAEEFAWKEYHEAYQNQDGDRLWTINKVKIEKDNGQIIIKGRPQAENHTFMQALESLAQFETFQKSQYPDQDPAEEIRTLGLKHFKAFAEREGILWDKRETPHILPHPEAIPPGAFKPEDIEAARKAAQKTAELPAPPQGDILAEIFNAAATTGNLDLALDGLIRESIIDKFHGQLSSFRTNFSYLISDYRQEEYNANNISNLTQLTKRSSKIIYCITTEYKGYDRYSKVKKARRHGFALYDLELSYNILKDLEKTGVDVSPLVTMLHTYEMATHLIYAQKLFKICRDFPQNTIDEANNIRTALADAEMIYKDYLNQQPREIYEDLKAKVTSGETPKMPAFIEKFLDLYQEKKRLYQTPVKPAK